MGKKLTMTGFLKGQEIPNKDILLKNLYLNNVPVELFFSVFGEKISEHSPEEVAKFVFDENNAYNGKNPYYEANGKCTLGASHSNYHGR